MILASDTIAAAVARAFARFSPPAEPAAAVADWAPLSAEAMAELRRPRTPRALAREIYDDVFNKARNAGMEPEKAHKIASAEVRSSMCGARTVAAEKPARVRPPHQVPVGGELVYNPVTDKIARIGDADDTTPAATPFNPEREAERAKFREAERLYAERMSNDVGTSEDLETWWERKYEKAEQLRQSHTIANSLECGGTVGYRTDEYQLGFWNVCTHELESLPNFRRLCFIPWIAAQVRASKLAALEFFISCHPYCRFWTFTSGPRVAQSGLRERIEYLHRRLSELNRELWRRYGCGLVFRSTELGTIETAETAGKARALRAAKRAHRAAVEKAKKDGLPAPKWTRAKAEKFSDPAGQIERDEKTGELMYHPHAHCVWYSPRGKLPDDEWSEMLRFVWKFWGHMWDDGKVIGDAREAVKYVLKPGEVASLHPRDLCALEKAVHGLRLVTPMGTLKKEIADRKARGFTLKRVQTVDGRVWAEVPDQNKQLASTEEERAARAAHKRQELLDRLDAKNVIVNEATGEVVSRGFSHGGKVRRKSDTPITKVLARMEAAASITPIKEPRVMVMFTRGAFDRRRVMEHPLVIGLWTLAVERFESARRSRIRFNKSTTTGETRVMDLLADTEERLLPDSRAVWEASTPVKFEGNDLIEAPEQLAFAEN